MKEITKKILFTVLAICLLLPFSTVRAQDITIDVGMGNTTMVRGKDGKNYLKIALKGNPLPEKETKKVPRMNVAIVIDRSSSMQGEKIEQARRAAIIAVEQLKDDDIVSVVAYSNQVEVIVPATKATNRQQIIQQISQIQSNGSTALYAGVAKGAEEVRKFLDKQMINRVVLLSDGQANVGPSSPAELGDFGAALAKEGMAVSTVGLGYGYNEDLMATLAKKSEGSFIFAESPSQLVSIFREGFNGARTVRCRKAQILIKFSKNATPKRCLGRQANITNEAVAGMIREIYEGNEKSLLVEVDVDAKNTGNTGKIHIADIEISYDSMGSGKTITLKRAVEVALTDKKEEAEKSLNESVSSVVAASIAQENNRQILALRDAGKIKEANLLNWKNDAFINKNIKLMPKNELLKTAREYNTTQRTLINAPEEEYKKKGRKQMIERQEAESLDDIGIQF